MYVCTYISLLFHIERFQRPTMQCKYSLMYQRCSRYYNETDRLSKCTDLWTDGRAINAWEMQVHGNGVM